MHDAIAQKQFVAILLQYTARLGSSDLWPPTRLNANLKKINKSLSHHFDKKNITFETQVKRNAETAS